jgi:hypothetical protein
MVVAVYISALALADEHASPVPQGVSVDNDAVHMGQIARSPARHGSITSAPQFGQKRALALWHSAS